MGALQCSGCCQASHADQKIELSNEKPYHEHKEQVACHGHKLSVLPDASRLNIRNRVASVQYTDNFRLQNEVPKEKAKELVMILPNYPRKISSQIHDNGIIQFGTPDIKKALNNDEEQIERLARSRQRQLNSENKVLGFANHSNTLYLRNEEVKNEITQIPPQNRLSVNEFNQGNNQISQQQLQLIIKKLFTPDDMSKWGNSEYGEGSNPGDVGRSQSLLPDNNMDRIKYLIDNYELTELLSIGYNSAIWKAQTKLTHQPCVLKIIRKQKYGKYWKKISTFFVKYRQLDHYNSARMSNVFTDKQYFYLVQDFVEGRSLYEEFLLQGGFTELNLSNYVKQIIQYLSILHQHSMYHSDIKPSNIMISKQNPNHSMANSSNFNLQNKLTGQIKTIKILNFANLINYSYERYQKKQYSHAEYFSPEQIEKSDDLTIMQCGELWNLGVILYVLYSGDFPFQGFSDEEVITAIITKPNNWAPKWREGLCDKVKDFILLCLDSDPFKRIDKILFINHPYILQNHTPQEIVSLNRILVQNIPRIFEIYAQECFVEAIIAYYSQYFLMKRQIQKLNCHLKEIDPLRLVFAPLENLQKAFQIYHGDDYSYKLVFDKILSQYLARKKEKEKPDLEIDLQLFFDLKMEIYQQQANKKLLKSVILLSHVGTFKGKYEEIDQKIQLELSQYHNLQSYDQYLIETGLVKRLILKTFPLLEDEWAKKACQIQASINFKDIRMLLDAFNGQDTDQE